MMYSLSCDFIVIYTNLQLANVVFLVSVLHFLFMPMDVLFTWCTP